MADGGVALLFKPPGRSVGALDLLSQLAHSLLFGLQRARNGFYSVHVNGNWVVTFTFDGNDADQVNYEDYH